MGMSMLGQALGTVLSTLKIVSMLDAALGCETAAIAEAGYVLHEKGSNTSTAQEIEQVRPPFVLFIHRYTNTGLGACISMRVP
eukprot:scaffold146258_cov20-Tisochrysis_lutea.AAC.2